MKKTIALPVLSALLVFAGAVWLFSDPTGEIAGQLGAVDEEQAALDRTRERTVLESRSGVEVPPVEAAPVNDSGARAASPPSADPPEAGASSDRLPEGYTVGTYRGPMRRAPRTSTFDPEPSPNPEWLGSAAAHDAILNQAARSGGGFTFAVLRVLPGADLQALDRSLEALGARIEGSTGAYARIRVPAERGLLEAIDGLAGVLGVGAIPPRVKADEAFVQEIRSRSASDALPVYVTLMASDPLGEWRRALSELGVVVGAYDSDLRSYTANLPSAALAAVLAADFVLSVEPVPVVTASHASAVPVMGVDGFRHYDPGMQQFFGLTGSGIAVGVLDTGLNTSHMDIAHGRASICGANFVTDENWDLWMDMNGHGTHVFGTIAGAGRADPLLAGMAPNLSHLRFGKALSADGFGNAEDIRRGMDFLSRPTGCSWQGTMSEAVKPLIVNMSLSAASLAFSGRGVGERKLDSVVRAHSQLYVVAQANAGQHGFSNFGTAKNSLAVGAVDDAGIIARFSSHGPTADGRLAPNVVGTGVRLTSARGAASLSGHDTFSGTSMASPSVAGVAALLMEERPAFRNRPALTRARLMASAIRPNAFLESRTQLTRDNTAGPGEFLNRYGLGLVSARTTLFSRDDPEGWLIGSASSQPDGDTYEYIDTEVPEGAGRLDVVLTWDEQPADTLTRSVLNNLDLWVDHGADCGEEACGEHASGSEVDNVEWLLIEDPVPGTYRIKVVPVEIYGESSTAAVAWKILRGEPEPELRLEIADTSGDVDSDYITVDVAIDASQYVASGTTLHLGCRRYAGCESLDQAYVPHRNRVHREDGVYWSDPDYLTDRFRPIPVGEVVAGTPRQVQLVFLRDRVPPGSLIHVTASSWNARSAVQSLAIGMDSEEIDTDFVAPDNDSFSASQHIAGATGETLLRRAHMWWNVRHNRLFALNRQQNYSFALPGDGSSLLSYGEIARHGGADMFEGIEFPGTGSSDGQFFYAVNQRLDLLQAFRVDSDTQLTHVQTVSSQGAPGDDALIVPHIGGAVDMTISHDGLHLYLATQGALLVFSRDPSAGTLELVREVSVDNSAEGPFRAISRLRSVSLDAAGEILFVSGLKVNFPAAFDAAVAAFDVSTDPANPAHLDTLKEMHFEEDLKAFFVRNHLRPRIGSTMHQCGELVPHADRPAVDVFCVTGGFYVVAWNPGTGALEVTDFAGAGADDRFGNVLPYHPGWYRRQWTESRRQIAQSPDGAHVEQPAKATGSCPTRSTSSSAQAP